VKVLAAIALLVAGCGNASLGGGDDTGNGTIDAAGGGSGSGSDIDASVQMIDAAAPACANGRKVYLNFDGVTLTQAATSDATMNKAKWMNAASSAVPPFRQGSGTRPAELLQIPDAVKARPTGTPIEVVTARPATAPYVMVVLGGASTAFGGTVASNYGGAVSFHDCGDAVKSDVGWVADLDGQTPDFIANFAVGAIGWGMGLDGANATGDCMCGWANGCSPAGGACTFANNAASSITVMGESACNAGTQNEITAFVTGFCQ